MRLPAGRQGIKILAFTFRFPLSYSYSPLSTFYFPKNLLIARLPRGTQRGLLPLLPSGPDGVCNHLLRRTRLSTRFNRSQISSELRVTRHKIRSADLMACQTKPWRSLPEREGCAQSLRSFRLPRLRRGRRTNSPPEVGEGFSSLFPTIHFPTEWRRERDSNPRSRYERNTRFPIVPLRPLGHLSVIWPINQNQSVPYPLLSVLVLLTFYASIYKDVIASR